MASITGVITVTSPSTASHILGTIVVRNAATVYHITGSVSVASATSAHITGTITVGNPAAHITGSVTVTAAPAGVKTGIYRFSESQVWSSAQNVSVWYRISSTSWRQMDTGIIVSD